jgi:hypothetical protein
LLKQTIPGGRVGFIRDKKIKIPPRRGLAVDFDFR